MSLILRNPHSVLAVLQTRPQDVLEITISSQLLRPEGRMVKVQKTDLQESTIESQEGWEKVIQLAEKQKIRIQTQDSVREGILKGLSKGKKFSDRPMRGQPTEESQRMSLTGARIKERTPLAIEELFSNISLRSEGKGLWIALDHVQDPHNVGAIFRTAAFFGVQGILLTQHRSAPLTGVAYDVASGGLEYVPFSIQTNLSQALKLAKEEGIWVLGSSEHAHDPYQAIKKDRPWLLVLGNEAKGMRRLTEESCDLLCKVSSLGPVTSLNVSVAAGILISHLS